MRIHMFRTALVTLVVLVGGLAACSSDDVLGKDADGSCKDLCTGAAFTSSRVDTQPNEINCFCSGGSGAVSAASCTSMCNGLGKAKSQPFKASGPGATTTAALDSCQCS